MKNTAHTPGQWKVEYPIGSRRPKVTAEKTTICDVGFELMEREVDHANAILIAAAPETARRMEQATAQIMALTVAAFENKERAEVAEARIAELEALLTQCPDRLAHGGFHEIAEQVRAALRNHP